jgi:molecular chaperone HtpG
MIYLLFYQACIAEGEEIEDISKFSKKLNNLLDKVPI